MNRALWASLVVVCAASLGLGGEAKRPSREVSLDEVIALALRHNLRVAAERIGLRRADAVVVEERAVFDPTLYSELACDDVRKQQSDETVSKHREGRTGAVGVAKLLPPGTAIDLHAGATRERRRATSVTTVNPEHDEEWGITVSQPLLRGRGVRVNTVGIALAANERRIAQAQLRDVALATVAEVSQAFWRLVLAIRDRALLERSLERARHLQDDVEKRVKARTIGARDPALDQAKAEVAFRREEILVADQAIRDAEDAIKVATDLAADPAIWKVALVPTTEPAPSTPPLDPDHAAQTALDRRLDRQQAQLAIESHEIVIHQRRNGLQPQLDLTAGYGQSGMGGSWHAAEHRLGSFDSREWSVGLVFEYPLGNRAARARFRRAKLGRDQARVELLALERRIQMEVRNAVRAVRTHGERLRAAAASIEAAQARLRTEEIRHRTARIGTIQDVLDAQDALAQAERRSLAALIDLNIAMVELGRLQGTLLDAHNVAWEDEP